MLQKHFIDYTDAGILHLHLFLNEEHTRIFQDQLYHKQEQMQVIGLRLLNMLTSSG